MFQTIGSFFGGLATKAKAKMTESLLQPFVDYHLENIFDQKIQISSLNKGVSNVTLNVKHLNQMMKTNILKEITISIHQHTILEAMKLEKLQLFMRDITIVIDLTQPSQIDSILKCIEIEDIMQQSIHIQMQDLKKEFLAVPQEMQKSNEPKKDLKTSSMTVFLLRLADSLFGNLKIDLQNLQLKIIGTKSKYEANLLLSVNSIKTQMQKLANTEQIYLNGQIDTIQAFINNKEQIAEISDALKLEIFLTGDQEPKISAKLSQMKLVVTIKQIEEIRQILNQGSIMLDERQAAIKVAFRSTKKDQATFKQLNQFKISSYFSNNNQQQQNIIENYEESQIIFEYNAASPQVLEFFQTTKQIQQQKEFLSIKAAGIHIYIPNQEQQIDFKNISKKDALIKDLDNYYSFIFSELQITKNLQIITYSIQQIYFYQLIGLAEKFHSFNDQLVFQSQDFECLNKKKLINRTILKAGLITSPLYDSTSTMIIEEPRELTKPNSNMAIQIVQNAENIQMLIPKFSIVLNQEQTAFFWKFIQTLTKSNKQDDNIQPTKEKQIILTTNKTDIQIFYYQTKKISLENSYNFEQQHQYQLIELKSFFMQTPKEKSWFSTKFEFEIAELLFDSNKIIGKNIKSEFGIKRPLKNSVPEHIDYNTDKETIDQYRKRCQERLKNQLTVQIDEVNINHEDFSRFYSMIQDMIKIFNPPNQPKTEQNFYFCAKINKIEVLLYQTVLLNLYKLKYHFVIDYQFLQIFDANALFLNKTSLLLMNQSASSQIFTMKMNNNKIDFVVFPIKINITNFEFSQITQCIENLLSDLKYLDSQENKLEKKNEKIINFAIEQLMFDLLPTYNEEVLLQKKNLTKLTYDRKEYPSWTRSIIVCNSFLFTKGIITVQDISLHFTSANELEKNDNQIVIDEYQKIATIHKIRFENKILSIDAIQLFQFSKQLFINLVDHVEHIAKDKKKNTTQVPQVNQYKKIDTITFPEPQFKIECHQISLTTLKKNLDIFLYAVVFQMSVKSCQLRIGRLQVIDNIQKSKFQYILDQEDLLGIDEIQSHILQQSPLLDCILLFDEQSLAMKLKIKPIRICLSGFQLKELLDSFNSKTTISKQMKNFDENDEDLLELIHQQHNFNLQVELEPILIIISFDSDGLEVDNVKAQFLKYGSFNNLILSTNKQIDFYKNSPTSKQEFIQYLMAQHLSTFGIIFQAYNSLEITKVASSFTNGIVNMFSKPFISKNGFFYGLIEGTYDFTCGLTSSLLSLTSMPANAINNVASFIGLGRISAPLQQLDEFCKKLYFKINPEQGIPERFYKT